MPSTSRRKWLSTERARRDDREAEKAKPIAEAAADDRARDEMQQRQDDDLLIVRRAAARGQTNDLQRGRELDRELEHARPR